MRNFKLVASAATVALWTTTALTISHAQSREARERMLQERFQTRGSLEIEQALTDRSGDRPTEAPTGFDNQTNGFDKQGPPFESIDEDNVVPLRSFNDNRFIFEEAELDRRRTRSDVQRARLPRVSSERRHRRRQSDR